MRVLMVVSDNTFPPDIRVEKEVLSLVGAGHEVGVLALELAGEGRRDRWHNVPVWRMRIPMRDIPKIGRSLELVLLRHFTARKISQVARSFAPAVIHVHDQPLARPASFVAQSLGTRLVVDFHEHYAGLVKDRVSAFVGRVAVPFLLAEEHAVVDDADAVITVVRENTERIQRAYGARAVYTVGNVPDLEEMRTFEAAYGGVEPRYDLCYVGGITPARGLETIIEAIATTDRPLKGVVVGDGAPRCALMRLAQELGATVEFTGALPFEEAMAMVLASKIGVVPHRSTLHTEHTIPHKLFQYMTLGTPPLVSDVGPLARVVEKHRCGAVFEASDPESCATAIGTLLDAYEEGDKWRQMVTNGREAVETKYAWSRCESELLQLYDDLERGDAQR